MLSKQDSQVQNGLPEISFSFINSFTKSKINYTNQWASHPTLEERKQRLEELEMNAPADDTCAWIIFTKPEIIQESITANLYKKINLDTTQTEYYDNTQFEHSYLTDIATYSLPAEYKGYYDKRFLNLADWDFDLLANEVSKKNFDEIFTEENGQLQSQITSLLNDIEILTAIKNKAIDVRSFDFNGEKYASTDCDIVIEKLQEELGALQQKQNLLDKEIYSLFYNAAQDSCLKVKEIYLSFKEIEDSRNNFIDIAQKTMDTLAPLYNGENSLEFVKDQITEIKYNYEPKLKKQLRDLLIQNLLSAESNKDLHVKAENFLKKDYGYFIDNQFQNYELNELHDLVVAVADHFNKEVFFRYKYLLQEQLRLYKSPQDVMRTAV